MGTINIIIPATIGLMIAIIVASMTRHWIMKPGRKVWKSVGWIGAWLSGILTGIMCYVPLDKLLLILSPTLMFGLIVVWLFFTIDSIRALVQEQASTFKD